MRLSRRLPPPLVSVFFVVVAVVSVWCVPAQAVFMSQPSPPSASITTGTLIGANSVAATQHCVSLVVSSVSVSLTWSVTSPAVSTWATGLQVFRSTSPGSGFASQGSILPLTTTTFNDTTVAYSTTYYYEVQASRDNWRATSNVSSATTKGLLFCA